VRATLDPELMRRAVMQYRRRCLRRWQSERDTCRRHTSIHRADRGVRLHHRRDADGQRFGWL